MFIKFNAKAFGMLELTPVPATEVLENGDFTITSNRPLRRLRTGDGSNERTEWELDFSRDPNWPEFSFDKPLSHVLLTLTISPKSALITTDIVRIKGLPLIETSVIRDLPVGETHTVQLNLLALGYTSEDITAKLREGRGKLSFLFKDDAIIPFAELELAQEVKIGKLLHVQARSEDTIAAPGNREPNYIVVSVMDAAGQPILGLTPSNFAVDATIVGPGGSLVDIQSAIQHNRMAGIYLLMVVPIKDYTWKSGMYIFSITVEDKGRRGQTLAKVLMD
jgi:hypothetical protein